MYPLMQTGSKPRHYNGIDEPAVPETVVQGTTSDTSELHNALLPLLGNEILDDATYWGILSNPSGLLKRFL